MNYRADIDGLRALAVVPVVLFHAQIPGFSGGFVGVDLFFVISGFLITSILVNELAENKFSLLTFYERRARRILPALLAMLIACVIAGYFLLRPDQYAALGKSALATLVFSSNIWFWHSTDYFSEPAEFNSLLHTWSLAVEEQYYLIFPLILIVLFRGRRDIFRYLLGFAILSFCIAEYYSTRSPSGAFYLAPARAWELMIGSMLSISWVRQSASDLPGWVKEMLGVAALSLILGSVFLLDEHSPFPGVYALPVILGGALLIYTGAEGTLVAKFLSLRVFVSIGLISYSLYLWHQPILVFSRLIDPVWSISIWFWIVLSFAAGWLSWRYVESPFRNKSRFDGGRIFRLSGVWTLVLGLAGLCLWVTDGLPHRIANHPYADIVGYDRKADRMTTWRFAARPGSFDAKGKIAVVGDSHAKDLYNTLVAGGCLARETSVLLTSNKLCGGGSSAAKTCPSSFSYPNVELTDSRGVVFAPFWTERQFDDVGVELAKLVDAQVPVLLVAPTPGFADVPPYVQNRLWIKPQKLADLRSQLQETIVLSHVQQTTEGLSELAEEFGVTLLKKYQIVCPAGECEFLSENNRLLFNDRTHWASAGYEYFGGRACRDERLKEFLMALP